MEKMEAVTILWDYLCLHQTVGKADCIIGFGCYNEDVGRRVAQLYRQGYAPLVLFSGGLGRNTRHMWTESEAERFARVAMADGVPENVILLENKSTNSGENLLFSRKILMDRGLTHPQVIGVHKPYMERRLWAAFPVYWPEATVTVTSWQQSFREYVAGVSRWGRTEDDTIQMLVGDFQRIALYPAKGYQIPQHIPAEAGRAFETLVNLGYTAQLAK